MLLAGVRNWLHGLCIPDAVIAAPSVLAPNGRPDHPLDPSAPVSATAFWSKARIAMAEGLWGEGFLLPGGESEVLRFARPLGLSGAASLLLVGAQTGGPVTAIARQLGVWVNGFESDPALAALGAERSRLSGLGKRVQVETWNPDQPVFRAQAYHHGLALEPLLGARSEPVLAAIGGALKPGGQLMLLETVAEAPLASSDPEAMAWARVENRRLDLPTEASITRMLGRLGFDVRGVEDLSQRHAHLAVLGWRNSVRRMREERPSPVQAALLVREAELWFRRLHLLRAGRLRLVRWHAVRKGGTAGTSHMLG